MSASHEKSVSCALGQRLAKAVKRISSLRVRRLFLRASKQKFVPSLEESTAWFGTRLRWPAPNATSRLKKPRPPSPPGNVQSGSRSLIGPCKRHVGGAGSSARVTLKAARQRDVQCDFSGGHLAGYHHRFAWSFSPPTTSGRPLVSFLFSRPSFKKPTSATFT